MVADWTVLHFDDPVLATNDLGYAPVNGPIGKGYVVPVDPQTAIFISPRGLNRRVLRREDGKWIAPLHHLECSAELIGPSVVSGIVANARHAIYGPSQASVALKNEEIGRESNPLLIPLVVYGGFDSVYHLYDYFRVLSILLSKDDPQAGRVTVIDWPSVLGLWTGPVLIEGMLTHLTIGGVSIDNEGVVVDVAFGVRTRAQRRAAGDPFTGTTMLVAGQQVDAAIAAFNPEMTHASWQT
jgi:hypothetical protein